MLFWSQFSPNGTSVCYEFSIYSNCDHDITHRFSGCTKGMVRLVDGLRNTWSFLFGSFCHSFAFKYSRYTFIGDHYWYPNINNYIGVRFRGCGQREYKDWQIENTTQLYLKNFFSFSVLILHILLTIIENFYLFKLLLFSLLLLLL